VKDESKFWQYVKKNTPNIKWTRIENSAALGTPDILGYLIHIRHPKNTFILVKDIKKKRYCMYLGSQIYELVDNGLKTKPITEDFKTYLEDLF